MYSINLLSIFCKLQLHGIHTVQEAGASKTAIPIWRLGSSAKFSRAHATNKNEKMIEILNIAILN